MNAEKVGYIALGFLASAAAAVHLVHVVEWAVDRILGEPDGTYDSITTPR